MATQDDGRQSIEATPWTFLKVKPSQRLSLSLWLALLGFLAFVPILGNEFVEWDDRDNFVENLGFQGIGLANIQWAWTTMLIGVYQPIAWMFLEVEFLFTGLNPYGYHLASALMHSVNTVVLFFLTIELVGRCRPDLASGDRSRLLPMSALAVALFAAHPMRTEVVAWVSAQPYLPCAFFAMTSVLAYLKANPAGATEVRSGWLLASFVLYAAAVLSKAAAIPLPAVFLILDIYPLGRLGGLQGWWNSRARRVLGEKLPFFALCGVFMVAAVVARVYDRNLDPMGNTGLTGRITLSCYSVMFYPLRSLWPFDMHAFYMRPRWVKLFDSQFLLAVAGTLAASTVIYLSRKRHPGMVVAWAAYLVMLAPVSGVVTTGMQVAADRYAYLTMMAFVAPMAVGFCDLAAWLARFPFRFVGWSQKIAAFTLIAALIFLTYHQCRTWKDSEALWSNGIEHGAGHVADLHNNLGAVWASKGHYEIAIFAFNEALRLKPHLKAAQDNLNRAMGHLARRNAEAKAKPKKQA